jgi:membrane protein DedA with SNARE-associated domain
MVAALLAVVHHFVKNKFIILGGAGLLVVAWLCYTIGMFIGTDIVTHYSSSQ